VLKLLKSPLTCRILPCSQKVTLILFGVKAFQSPLHCVLPFLSQFLLAEAAALKKPLDPPTLTSVDHILLPDVALNSTYIGAIDETKFSTEIKYGSTTLPATSVLMIAVNAMVQLALQDFESKMARKVFVLDIPRYANVEITVGPWDEAPATTMPAGFAVIGLYQAMLSTLREPTQRFRNVEATLVYNEVNVGRLWIWRRPGMVYLPGLDNSSLSESTLPTSSDAAKSLNGTEDLVETANTASLPTAALNDPRLHITTIHGLDTFTIYELFIAALTFMIVENVKPRTSRVRGFTIIVDEPPITTASQPIAIAFRELGNPPRTPVTLPYLQTEWLIKAVGGLPAQTLGSGVFKDVISMALEVDDVLLTNG